jgi:hypothetical protein
MTIALQRIDVRICNCGLVVCHRRMGAEQSSIAGSVLSRCRQPPGADPAAAGEDTFLRNGWSPGGTQWRVSLPSLPFDRARILGFVTGTARLLLGGPNGQEIPVSAGDCALLPPARAIAVSRRARTFWWSAAIRPANLGICAAKPSARLPSGRWPRCRFPTPTLCWGRQGRCSRSGRALFHRK